MMETLNITNTERRKRFSHVLLKFSKMNSMCSYLKIEKYEFLNAILIILGKDEINIKDYLFAKDLYHLFDLSLDDINVVAKEEKLRHEVEEILHDFENSPQILYDLINSQYFKASANKSKKTWENAAIEQKKIKKQLFADIKNDTARFHKIVTEGYIHRREKYFDFVVQKLRYIGINTSDIESIGDYVQEHFEDFLKTMPMLYVAAKLTFQRFKNSSKPFHKNDIKDIAFLSPAIPYCDIVITERSWVDYIRREKLDILYGTEVFSDLNDILTVDSHQN